MDETEDTDYIAPEHDQLLSAISKLDKTQHISAPTRNEPTTLNTEFNLIKRSNKLNLEKVVKVLEDTAKNVQITKKLQKSQDASKVLPKPLEKPQVQRIKRATGYTATKKTVGRWDPVVARNRTVDFVSFPLKSESAKLQPTSEFLSKLKLKSPLEKELEEIDPPAEVEQEEEDEKIYPMSYEEMVEHRKQSAKMRAQHSYKAAKAKRQGKIKSKKYHRILKKEKLKQQLKEFEELQQKDPEEALKKLEALEKARALERHTLRHKNTGKWAKSKLVRAKYDKEVRQELAEQLAVSRELTHKTQDNETTDDEVEDDNGIPDMNLSQDPLNPWMLKRADKSNVDAEFDFGYKKYLKDRMYKCNDNSETESEEEKAVNDHSEKNDDQRKVDIDILKRSVANLKEVNDNIQDDVKIEKHSCEDVVTPRKLGRKSNKIIATSQWLVEDIVTDTDTKILPSEDISSAFESLEDKISKKIESKLKGMRKKLKGLEKRSKHVSLKRDNQKSDDADNLEYFGFKNTKLKPIIDEALLETTHKTTVGIKNDEFSPVIKEKISEEYKEKSESNIDPNTFIEVKPKYLNTAITGGPNLDDLDDDEQVVPKVNIEEVFEEDDVVASFRQEKEDEANNDTPQDIDLSLPGWGSWGGKGVKPVQKRKRNRFILKAPPKMPRRDENKGDIIIREFKNPKLTAHKVTEIPFPFNSLKEYEASIRAPLGNTFIPETAHKKLIKPNVITKAGAIIEPMDEDELLVRRNRNFRDKNVIKLLGQK